LASGGLSGGVGSRRRSLIIHAADGLAPANPSPR
jgi:hypothetical protein